MKKSNLIIGIVLAIAVLVGGVFWYLNNSQKLKIQTKAEKVINNNQQQNQQRQGEEKQQIKKDNTEKNSQEQVEKQNILELKIDDADQKNLFDAFMNYLKNNDQESFNAYKNKKLHTSTGFLKHIKGREYIKTIIWIEGQHSAPYILAVKDNSNWIIVFRGQDHPSCDVIDKYNIPNEIYDVCFDGNILRCAPNSKDCY